MNPIAVIPPCRRTWTPVFFVLLLLLLAPRASFAQGAQWSENKLYLTEVRTGEANVLLAGLEDVGEPISTNSGAFYYYMNFLKLGGPMKLKFFLSYRSDHNNVLIRKPNDFPDKDRNNPTLFWWGPRCIAAYSGASGEYLNFWMEDGAMVAFKNENGWSLYEPDANNGQRIRYRLRVRTAYIYLMNPMTNRVYIFQNSGPGTGRIRYITDRNGNRLSFNYAQDDHNNPSSVDDGLGRRLLFTYANVTTAEESMVKVEDDQGRQVVFSYGMRGDNNGAFSMNSVSDPEGRTTNFRYQVAENRRTSPYTYYYDNIKAVVKPRGNVPYEQQYGVRDSPGGRGIRVVRQGVLENGNRQWIYDLLYNNPSAYETTEMRGVSGSIIHRYHNLHGAPESWQDMEGRKVTFTRDDNDRVTGMTDRYGGATSWTYHLNSGKTASLTNARGDRIAFDYERQDQTFGSADTASFSFYNLKQVRFPDGTVASYSYDERGNTISATDRLGRTTLITYNGRGQPLTVTNPAGGIVTYTYNSDATLASRTDSGTGVTRYSYDAYRRLEKITHPDGSTRTFVRDKGDWLLSVTDGLGRKVQYVRDANGNLLKRIDPLGRESVRTYDEMDRIKTLTDRTGRVRSYDHSPYGHLKKVDYGGVVVKEFDHNAMGKLTQRWDGQQNTWYFSYDEAGMIKKLTTPLGLERTFERDPLGGLSRVTDALGNVTSYSYDKHRRPTRVTDPEGRITSYGYDLRGRLSLAESPVLGRATYGYNALGAVSAITDLKGGTWRLHYTPMGRLSAEEDPLGNQITLTRDTRGRTATVTYPGGGSLTSHRDAVGNVTLREYSAGPVLSYSYDEEGRLTATDGLAVARDGSGRVVNTQASGQDFGATYDEAGRLKTVTYPGGRTVTYSYDSQRNVLSSAVDNLPLAGRVYFTWDADRRLSKMTRSNSVGTLLDYDDVNRLTRIQVGRLSGNSLTEAPHLDLTYGYNGVGQVTASEGVWPIDPGMLGAAALDTFAYDAASRLTVGYAYDGRGRLLTGAGEALAWDGASRLVAQGQTTYTYNGAGDLIRRDSASGSRGYYYNYALKGAPLVAERDESTGDFLRYYVWTPEGRLLYFIDVANGNKVYYYHLDRLGSVLAVTDVRYVYPGVKGFVVESYAYGPYGKLLKHEGTCDQPFTFLGNHGVRKEGRFYRMGARLYDPETARFLSRDPERPNLHDLRTLNPYGYVGADPLNAIDADGRKLVAMSFCFGPPGSILARPINVWVEESQLEGKMDQLDSRLSHLQVDDDLSDEEGYQDYFDNYAKSIQALLKTFTGDSPFLQKAHVMSTTQEMDQEDKVMDEDGKDEDMMPLFIWSQIVTGMMPTFLPVTFPKGSGESYE